MNIIVLRVGDKEMPEALRALAKAGIRVSPPNETQFGRLPFTFAATPGECVEHREAQCEMFAACGAAGLDTKDKAAMIEAINFFLGLNLTSRTQMTPAEMRAVTNAAAAGFWSRGWKPRRCA